MKGATTHTLGMFEGYNFRSQSAIERLLSAEEVLDWDHDGEGEAEFWPDGSNVYVQKLLQDGACTAQDIREVRRIIEEVQNRPRDLAAAIYLIDCGAQLDQVGREAIDEACLYVFGPGPSFIDMKNEAAFELFEMFWSDVYRLWELSIVPGLCFHPDDFLDQFPTLELTLPEGKFLVVDTH